MAILRDLHSHLQPFEFTPDDFYVGRSEIPRAFVYAVTKKIKPAYVRLLEGGLRLVGKNYRLYEAYKIFTSDLAYQIRRYQDNMEKSGVSSGVAHVIDLNPLDTPDYYGTGALPYEAILEAYVEALKGQDPNKPQIRLFLGVDPRRANVLELMEKFLTGPDTPFIGVKVYPKLGWKVNDHRRSFWYSKTLYRIYAFCASLGIPMMSHTSGGGLSGPDGMRTDVNEWHDVLFDFPKLHVCLAHSGGSYSFLKQRGMWLDVERVLLEHEFAFSGLSFHEHMVSRRSEYQRSFLKVMGSGVANKLLWGIDWPFTSILYPYSAGVSAFRAIAGESNLEIVSDNTDCYLGISV